MAVSKELLSSIDSYLAENREKVLEDLKTLARIPSVLGEPEEGAPYGKPCLDVLKAAAKLFSDNGCKAEIYGGRYALAEHGSGDKTIGIFGHCDVVPVGEGWVYTEPFNPIEKDGFMIGRGVSDNKAGVTMSLYVVKLLKAMGIELKNKLICYMGAAEETGMSDIDAFVREQRMPDLSIVPDGSFPVSRGEKGMCRFWATAPKAFKAVKEFRGGSAFNVALDGVTVRIAGGDDMLSQIKEKIDGNSRLSAEKDGDEIVVTARGITKHAANPDGSLNAAWIAADMLKDIDSIPKDDREILKYAAHILDGYYGVNLTIAHEDPVFGKLSCVNGMVKIADGKLKLSYDIRYGTTNDSKKMVEAITRTLNENGWDVEITECEDGFLLPLEGNQTFEAMVDVYRQVSGDTEAKWAVMAGGTYCRRLENAYSIGTQAPYKRRKLDLPEGHGGSHQCDESLTIDAFFEAIKILTATVIECDKTL